MCHFRYSLLLWFLFASNFSIFFFRCSLDFSTLCDILGCTLFIIHQWITITVITITNSIGCHSADFIGFCWCNLMLFFNDFLFASFSSLLLSLCFSFEFSYFLVNSVSLWFFLYKFLFLTSVDIFRDLQKRKHEFALVAVCNGVMGKCLKKIIVHCVEFDVFRSVFFLFWFVCVIIIFICDFVCAFYYYYYSSWKWRLGAFSL